MKKKSDNIAGYTAMQFILFGFLLLYGLFVALSLSLFIWLIYCIIQNLVGCYAAVYARTEERMNK